MPPGITYWDLVDVITPNGKGRVWAPRTKPMARISHTELTDTEIVGLLQDLKRIVLKRGLTVDWDSLQPRDQTGVMECSPDQGTDRAVSLANQTQWREAAEQPAAHAAGQAFDSGGAF
jgi:hypothetical protein